MMPAARHFDPVLGIDVHIIQPAGPVPPVPIPHPFVGMVIDPFDYVPVLGATVMVNGIPRAQAGTAGKCVPSHIPMGGTFVKPPGNESEVFMGSSSVAVDGDAFSYLAVPSLTCQDVGMPPPPRAKKKSKTKSLVLPTSVTLPIPAGPPVLVGGAPTISLMALGMRAGMAALGRLGRGLRRLQRGSGRVGRAMRRVSDRLHSAARNAMDRLGVPPSVRNRVHRAICSTTGHPVDVATGKVYTEAIDFEMPGPLVLQWERVWYSSSTYDGPLGHGWHHSYDWGLVEDREHDVVAVRTADGRSVAFPILGPGESAGHRTERLTLRRGASAYALTTAERRTFRFAPVAGENGVMPVLAVEDLPGNRITFQYGRDGQLSDIIDSGGRHLSVVTDPSGRIAEILAPDPDHPESRIPLIRYGYDEDGNLVSVVDAENQSSHYAYHDHLMIKETDRNGFSFHFAYDRPGALARCTETWGDGGLFHHKLVYQRDISTTEVIDSLENKTIYQWDENGVVTQKIEANGALTTTLYDDAYNVLQVIDADGNVDQYAYDEHGRCTAYTEPTGGTERYAYNERGQLTEKAVPSGAVWRYAYDDSGNCTQGEDPDGGIWRQTADHRGRITAYHGPNGDSRRYHYDDMGNLIDYREKDRSARYRYDFWGRLIEETGFGGKKRTYRYDRLGRCTQSRFMDAYVFEAQYDAEGNMTAYAAPGEGTVSYRYGPLGRLQQKIHADGAIVEYAYDSEGRLVRITNELGEPHRFQYDAVGEIVRVEGFDGAEERYHYSSVGNLLRIENREGPQIEFAYDAANRITRKTLSDGTQVAYQYDPNGDMIAADTGTHRVQFERDMLGRIVREIQDDAVVELEYDHNDRIIRRKSPLGHEVGFRYDPRGTLSQVTLPDGHRIAFSYDKDDVETQRHYSSGVRIDFQYDAMGRQTRAAASGRTGRLFTRRTAYDPRGLVVQIDDSGSGTTRFAYDARGRIREAIDPSGTVRNAHADAAGNLFRGSLLPGARYGRGNRLERTQTHAYTFDGAGKVIARQGPGRRSERFGYDPAERMRFYVSRHGKRYDYAYDAFGRRISKSDAGEAAHCTRFTYEDHHLLTEVTAHHAIEYVYFPDSYEPLAMIVDGVSFFVHTDHQGAVREISDGEGVMVYRAVYDALGQYKVLSSAPGLVNHLRLQGQYHDQESGLHYNLHRYFEPSTGRYITPDPIRTDGGLNFYAYGENVLNYIDPLGLNSRLWALVRMAIVLAGMTQQPGASNAVSEAAKAVRSAESDRKKRREREEQSRRGRERSQHSGQGHPPEPPEAPRPGRSPGRPARRHPPVEQPRPHTRGRRPLQMQGRRRLPCSH